MVILQKYTLLEFQLFNNLSEAKVRTLQVKPQINFKVFPRQEKKPLVGELTVEVGSMDDNSPLYIKLKMSGQFIPIAENKEDAIMDIKEFHKQAFPVIFDVARSHIAGTTLMGGLTPFYLPPIDPSHMNFGVHKE